MRTWRLVDERARSGPCRRASAPTWSCSAAAPVGVVAMGEDGEECILDAKVVVDASGRDGLLSRAQGGHQRLPELDKTALFTHVDGGHRNEGIDAGQIEIVILAGANDDGST